MTLSVLTSGPNAQVPISISEVFLPDQLIAGDLKTVSDSVTVSGATQLLRGSVLGQVKFGTVTASVGKAFASQTITVAALPVAGDVLTVNGTAITFAAQPVLSDENPPPNTLWTLPWVAAEGQPVAPASTLSQQASQICAYLNASTNANISKMTYSVAAAVITATSIIAGVGGNAYTLAATCPVSSAFTLGGATLAGGTGNTGSSTVGSISGGADLLAGNYIITASATNATSAFTVVDPHGVSMPPGAVGTAYASSHINFTITDNNTTAGDKYVLTGNPTKTGVYKLAVASAIDGSQAPVAVLADNCDPTAGNVTAGVYLNGELNGAALIYDPSFNLATIKSAFRPQGLFVKTSVSAADPS